MKKPLSIICQIFQNIAHYIKCILIWFVCTKIVGLWMISLHNEPNISIISDSDLTVSYANLSKYQNNACFDNNLSFSVMEEREVRFLLQPSFQCLPYPSVKQDFKMKEFDTKVETNNESNIFMIVMTLSAPKNFEARNFIRNSIKNWTEATSRLEVLKPLFLLGDWVGNEELHQRIQEEQNIYGDILQSSIIDGYNKLSYKTVTGFVWTNCFCPDAQFILKIDDDVVMNYEYLVEVLKDKYNSNNLPDNNVVECPSPLRNKKPFRPRASGTNTVLGKWSVKTKEMDRRVHPSFCPGWAYVTTPKMGIKMAEMSSSIPSPENSMKRLDDIYMTGFTVERIPSGRVEQLEAGHMGYLWNKYFSYCPFLGITKSLFFNNFIVQKGAYIGGGGRWFFWCAFWEYWIVDPVEFFMGNFTPSWIIQMCNR